jgi:hypothetical protein
MQRRLSAALLFVALSLTVVAKAAALPSELADAASQGTMVSFQNWRPELESDTSLQAAIITTGRKDAPPGGTLVVYDGDKRVFSFNSDQLPVSMFVMGEAGNLATLWEAGDGTYILCIFTYQNGKTKKVLEGSSKLLPEFVYEPTPPGSLIVDAKQHVPGGYWSERIIIANMDWVHDAKTGASEYLPVTADVFTWDGERYRVRESVKWTERLK